MYLNPSTFSTYGEQVNVFRVILSCLSFKVFFPFALRKLMVCLRQALVYNAGEYDKMESLRNTMMVSAFYGGDSRVDKGILLNEGRLIN